VKRLLIVGGVVIVGGAAALLAKRGGGDFALLAKRGGPDFERLVERMPENAPPKWVFRNITAIRQNTERILQLLESERKSAGAEETAPGGDAG
jgi:hypothetical protein